MTSSDRIRDFIENDSEITVSKQMLSFIMQPDKLNNLNKSALEKLVVEYKPLYKRFGGVLYGSPELTAIVSFNLYLKLRIANKPELQTILEQ